MANRFDVTPLGGFNLGAGIQQLGQTIERRQEQEELKNRRQEMQDAVLAARKGDADALDKLYSMNPDLGFNLEGQIKDLENQGKLRATTDAAIRWAGATDPDQKMLLREEFMLSDEIDFGDDEENMTDEQLDLATNLFLHKQELSPKGPSIGTYNPRDYTTESFSEFQRTGDPAVLERYEKDQFKEIGGVTYRLNPATDKYDIVVDPEKIAETEGKIAGAKEEGKLKKELQFKPQIQKAVALAQAEAAERGEVLNDLKRAEAALPGLKNAVGQLRELAPIATSTIGGKIFDQAVKQTGFGSTKGATARKKFIAIVNNQVLPLLKPTFGAAFTVQEGEALRATMGDPDSTPEEKMAQLDAFIDQKMRDIQTKQSQLGVESTQLTDEELDAKYGID